MSERVESRYWLKYVWSLRSSRPADIIRVDRSTLYGNPFEIGQDGDRNRVCDKHEIWLRTGDSFGNIAATKERRIWILQHIHELREKNIACWCRRQFTGERCHAEFLAEIANTQQINSSLK